MNVKVEEVKEEVKPSAGVCKVLGLQTAAGRTVTANLTGEVSGGAQIIGYRINFGDGTISNKQTDTHKYAKDGTYIVTGEVLVKYADGTEEWKTAEGCKSKVTFIEDKPPVVQKITTTPTVLPETGPAGVAAAFTAVSGLSSLGYYLVTRRRSL